MADMRSSLCACLLGAVGKPPMGIARNDIGETCSAAAFDSKIPQERAQAGRQLLDGSIYSYAIPLPLRGRGAAFR